ncbi:hypothetical protein J3P91_20240 [Pseudomonas sp. Z4-7]
MIRALPDVQCKAADEYRCQGFHGMGGIELYTEVSQDALAFGVQQALDSGPLRIVLEQCPTIFEVFYYKGRRIIHIVRPCWYPALQLRLISGTDVEVATQACELVEPWSRYQGTIGTNLETAALDASFRLGIGLGEVVQRPVKQRMVFAVVGPDQE